MKENKTLSALEKLQLKKIRLQAEADQYAGRLDKHVDYLQNNFGMLLTNTVLTAVMSKLPPVVRNLLPLSGATAVPEQTRSEPQMEASILSVIADQALDILPLFFKGSKSMIIMMVLKQVKNLFFRKKQKKL